MKKMQEERGSIAVFLLVCLLPMILFEAAIFDGIKLMGSKSILADAATLSLDGGLAGYDRDLKEAYGLYAVTDSGKAAQEVETFFRNTVNPTEEGVKGASSGSGFYNMTVNVKTGGSEGSQLSKTEVFQDQIWEYTKYYVETDQEDLKYPVDGTVYLGDAYELIWFQCAFDREAHSIQIGKTDSTAVLEVYYGNWKKHLDGMRDGHPLKAASQRELENAGKILDGMKTYVAERKKLEEADEDYPGGPGTGEVDEAGPGGPGTGDDGDQVPGGPDAGDWEDAGPGGYGGPAAAADDVVIEPVDSYEIEQVDPGEQAREMDAELRRMIGMAEPDRYGYSDFSERYPESHADAKPDWIESTLSSKDDYDVIIDKMEDFLSESLNTYQKGSDWEYEFYHPESKMNRALVLYAGNMFSCYVSPVSSLSGNNHFSGAVPSAIPYTEIEYILCGGSDPNENAKLCIREWQNYLTMWCILEEFFADSDMQNTFLNEAETLAEGEYSVPYYRDLFRFAHACSNAESKWLASIHGGEVEVYQITQTNTIRYRHFMQVLLNRFIPENREAVLDRMQTVIEKNMQKAGHTNFSFDSAYTMLWIDAEVQVKTLVLPKQTLKYKDVATY